MILHRLPLGGSVGPARDVPTICIPFSDGYEGVSDTLAGLLPHTSPRVLILLAGATGPGLERIEGEVADYEDAEHKLLLLGLSPGVGFAETANVASTAVSGDLVLVAVGVGVGPEWLDRLSSAAQCDSTVVSATALGDQALSLIHI